jgi:hypothetical protein
LNIANAYYKQGRFSDALEQYTIAGQLYPEGVQRTDALTMVYITAEARWSPIAPIIPSVAFG